MSLTAGGVVVFSGGSAANNLVDVFNEVVALKGCQLSYIIPISDNGGSSSELIRVFGGPGIGDVRSRLVRLIPDDINDRETHAIKTFFNYRLSSDPHAARIEWLNIVDARHELWDEISSPKKELIRSFLNVLNLEIVKKTRPSSVFSFESASIGNMFLTGARLFTGSFESSIYLLSSICNIPTHISVFPAINTNFSHHICAGLSNGDQIPGQNSISHPSGPTAVPAALSVNGSANRRNSGHAQDTDDQIPIRLETEQADFIEDANLPGSLPTLRKQYIAFSKDAGNDDDLPAPIDRIWYINPYGQEIRPPANSKIINALLSAECIIYSIGSLYTSIVPSLILRGVGNAVAYSRATTKVLILNGTIDRETGPRSRPYTSIDFVRAIAKACKESEGIFGERVSEEELSSYVTHLIYLEGEGAPAIDKTELRSVGIELVRVYGRSMENGRGWRYDPKGLSQALEAIVGRRDRRFDRSRRQTLEQ